ncbi:MAG: hypothetical protein WCK32_02145 [Chlorobiaceae bacterium]
MNIENVSKRLQSPAKLSCRNIEVSGFCFSEGSQCPPQNKKAGYWCGKAG